MTTDAAAMYHAVRNAQFLSAVPEKDVRFDFGLMHDIRPKDIGCSFESFDDFVKKVYGLSDGVSLDSMWKEVSPGANAARLAQRANAVSGIKVVAPDSLNVGDGNLNRKQYLEKMWEYLKNKGFIYISSSDVRVESVYGRENRQSAVMESNQELVGTWVKFRIFEKELVPYFVLTYDGRCIMPSCSSVPLREVGELRDLIDDCMIPEIREKQIQRIIGVDASGNLTTSAQVLDPKQRVACTEMFPYAAHVFPNGNLTEFIDEFMNSQENLFLIRGVRGSGKSTLGRTMAAHVSVPVYYCTNVKVAANPNFFAGLELIIQKHKNQLLVIFEECDALLQPKLQGEASLVSDLLNASDGLVETRIKMVFITNLTGASAIDENLIRTGRMFYQLVCRMITNAQARHLRQHLGMGELDNDAPELTVADALSKKRAALRQSDNKPGFTN